MPMIPTLGGVVSPASLEMKAKAEHFVKVAEVEEADDAYATANTDYELAAEKAKQIAK